MITASIEKASNQSTLLHDEDILVFDIMRGSRIDEAFRLEITLKEASERVGLPKDFLVPICTFLLEQYIEITEQGTAQFDPTRKPKDLMSMIILLQAKTRGINVRNKIANGRHPSEDLVARKKLHIGDSIFLASGYSDRNKLIVELWNTPKNLTTF